MAQPRMYVQAPPVTPLPFGIFSAATVLEDADPHFALGGVEYEPASCFQSYETGPACTPDPENLEDSEGIPLVSGDPFVVYQLFSCKAPGSIDRGAARARESLQGGEQRAVEAALSRIMAGEGLDLSESEVVHPVDGLAMLERFAAVSYGGTPVIHMHRDVGTVLGTLGAIQRQGVQLQTVQGAVVSSGGGYDLRAPDAYSDGPAANGFSWMYVTGQVVLHRSPVIEVGPTLSVRPANNVFRALAQRSYTATTECITAAVAVTTGYSTPDGAA